MRLNNIGSDIKCSVELPDSHAVFLPVAERRRGGGPKPLTPEQRVARFWSRTQRAESGCLLWTGGCTPDGYGLVNLGRDDTGRQINDLAHRVAYKLRHGPIPPGLCVIHTCDVRNCLEDAHHRLGTHGDNMRDAKEKGRLFTGTRPVPKRGRKFLTETERNDIRAQRAAGITAKEVARRFDISLHHAIKIGTGTHKTVLELAREHDHRLPLRRSA